MSSDLKRFAVYFAKAIIILLVLDFAIGEGLGYLYGKMTVGERARADFAINKSEADLYIFGASRAVYQYHPTILQDSLHMSVYNAGRSAQTMLYHLTVFKMLLKRHKPKMVIVDINVHEFTQGIGRYDLIYSLLPYYRSDESVRQMIDLIKPGYRYFSWSHTLPYNSSIFAILYRSMVAEDKNKDTNGYIFLKGHKLTEVERFHNCREEVKFDPIIINSFYEFVSLCRENNIKLQVITSPYFSIPDCPRADFQKVKDEIAKLKINYLDLSDDQKYLGNLNYMYDVGHLNYEGSVEFTKEIAGYIKQNQQTN